MWWYSRKWLVRQEDDSSRVVTRTTSKNVLRMATPTVAFQTPQTHTMPTPESRQRNRWLSSLTLTHSTLWRRLTPKLAKVNTCLNQILEVLLALLLANCLMHIITHLPAQLEAYELNNLDDEAPSIYAADYMQRMDRSYRHSAFAANLPYAGVVPNGFALNDSSAQQLQRSQNFKISPKPCSIGRIDGTCMFVWECIKSEGQHVGMCVDSFMFGSCCVHNYTDNIVLPQPFSYTRPTKPAGMANVNHRPRPPHQPHRPIISGMTTIERPHGAGTLVIRPSGPHHQGALHRPMHNTKPTTTTSQRPFITSGSFVTSSLTNLPHSSQNEVFSDNLPSPSAANNVWNSSPTTTTTQQYLYQQSQQQTTLSATQQQQQQQQHHQHWHLSTEPNFITKPRPPPSWEKPSSLRPKPSKPTKKPIVTAATASERPLQQQAHQTTPLVAIPNTSTRKPTASTTTTTATTSKTTTTSRPKPTNAQEPLLQHTKPLQTSTTTTTTTTTTSKRPNTSPPTSSSSSNTASDDKMKTTTSAYPQMQPTKYSTEKYRPSTSSPLTTSLSAAASSSTTTLPSSSSSASSSTTTEHIQRPPQSSSSSSTTTTPTNTAATSSLSSSGPSQTLPPQSHTTIESNEIIDATAGITTVKTISAARSGECGIPVLARPETRIVGGKSAAFGRWPWQVSVRRTSFFGFSSTHRCGGALINENWIATAGHCVDDLLISQIRIRVGEYDFSHVQEQLPYIERAVAKKVVHPKYNFFTYEYDLALVKLEQPLEFAPHVSPICLPQTDSLMIGMNATVTGWGRLSEGGTLPSVLQEVSVPIVSNDNCKNMFLRAGRQEFIPEIFLCAGYETGGQDSCQGDSGGPLQVKSQDGRFFLAGIISWGIGCAEANLPGVCTRISKFVPWILEIVT